MISANDGYITYNYYRCEKCNIPFWKSISSCVKVMGRISVPQKSLFNYMRFAKKFDIIYGETDGLKFIYKGKPYIKNGSPGNFSVRILGCTISNKDFMVKEIIE